MRTELRSERGSVTPLAVGMVLCLLLISVGITAATSAFLARSNLQNACDGAAASAAEATKAAALRGPDGTVLDDVAYRAAGAYFAERGQVAVLAATASAQSTALRCTGSAPITVGAVFGAPDMTFTVSAVGFPVL